jgi:hypothetical protein
MNAIRYYPRPSGLRDINDIRGGGDIRKTGPCGAQTEC